MPIFYQQELNEHTRIGVWKIEEAESFFYPRIPLSREITHPHKRLQHLAGRHLLSYLFPDFPLDEIRIADTRKPFLEKDPYHFSISHCGDFAAAIVSTKNRVGVDIELITPKVERVADKFLTEAEKSILFAGHLPPASYRKLLTIMWSAKEALYKWYGSGQVDFRAHMQLATNSLLDAGADGEMILPFWFMREQKQLLQVQARAFGDLELTWVSG